MRLGKGGQGTMDHKSLNSEALTFQKPKTLNSVKNVFAFCLILYTFQFLTNLS